MSTRPRSTAAKRRKILFVVAAGALALGAAPASAAGDSPSPSGTLDKHPDRIAVVCDAVERHQGADARDKGTVPGKGTVLGKAKATGKAKAKGGTPSQVLCGRSLPGKPGKPTEPGWPDLPGGDRCVVVVMKPQAGQKKATAVLPGRHGERVKRGERVERVRPAKPIRTDKPDRSAKPGEVCGVFVMTEGTVVGR
ncbi:hypothetical protein ABVG11_25760 [Streptomyces sp. HD1123-B1]|uniref:hypothetical protein n=1 Tax=Streptomyces huangiella TaxID=3228804 RepID=UPI003D7E72FD